MPYIKRLLTERNSSCKYYSNEHHQNLKVMYNPNSLLKKQGHLIKAILTLYSSSDDPLGFVLPLLPSSAAYLQGEKGHYNITQVKISQEHNNQFSLQHMIKLYISILIVLSIKEKNMCLSGRKLLDKSVLDFLSSFPWKLWSILIFMFC